MMLNLKFIIFIVTHWQYRHIMFSIISIIFVSAWASWSSCINEILCASILRIILSCQIWLLCILEGAAANSTRFLTTNTYRCHAWYHGVFIFTNEVFHVLSDLIFILWYFMEVCQICQKRRCLLLIRFCLITLIALSAFWVFWDLRYRYCGI